MTIPAHYYYSTYDGFSEIIRIESNWTEESTGYQNEHIHEKIACTQKGKYYIVLAHLKQKTMGGEDFDILNKTEISKEEYEDLLKKHKGIIDTKEYREIVEQTRIIIRNIEDADPTCPKCGAVMTERNGKFGQFWGCTGYPKCNGTKKDPNASEKKKALWSNLSRLNQELSRLENK